MVAARITAAIANELRNGVGDVLRQGAAVATGNQGDYIANGQPESIYGKLQQATARQYCRRYADNPGAYSGRPAVLAEKACRPYLDDIGYGSPPAIAPPYQGGQCPVEYTVFATNGGVDLSIGGQTPLNITGPLGSPSFTQFIVPNTNPALLRREWRFPNDPGSVLTYQVVAEFAGAPGFRVAGRVDGQSDNCGNPPPDITPPVPPVLPGPPRERYNPSPDIDVDITVEINPDLTVNIDFGDGGGTIDPFEEPTPPGGGGDGPPPGDVGSPGGTEGTGEGGEAEGEAPPGSVLVGLKIAIVGLPERPNEYAPGVYRGVAYIYMGTATGLDQDYAGSMLSDGQFIFAEKDNLTHWRVRANNEYNLNVTPYYREVEEP